MKKLMIVLSALLLAGAVQAAGNAEAGKAKAAVCAACHGADGKAIAPTYPNLAGQNAPYLELAIKAYKTQERKGAQAVLMYGMVAALSEQDIADLAAYYASLQP